MTRGRIFRLVRLLRWLSIAGVVFGPIAMGAWRVHAQPAPVVDAATVRGPATEYLKHRNPVVDELLPEGAGGTQFTDDLGDAEGKAFLDRAAIALSTSVATEAWRESTELHERAHLLQTFLPEQVAAVLAVVSRPAPGEYAATNSAEHFAEMAARAWEVVTEPDGFCIDGTPADRLRDDDRRVPGTAGFVLWFLRRVPEPQGGADLSKIAATLSASQREQWNALWLALEARRQSDGHFPRWGYSTVREYIEARRREARATGGLDRVIDLALIPSLAVLTLVGH